MTAGGSTRQLTGACGSRKLRIALVIESSGGGSGRHVLDLAEGLLKLNHRVVLIYSGLRIEAAFKSRMCSMAGLESARVDMPATLSIRDLQAAWRLKKVLRRLGPFDIVHAHSSKAGGVLRVMTNPRSTAIVYTPHAVRTMDPKLRQPARLLYATVERWLARYRSRAVIAVSGQELAECRRIGIPDHLLSVVCNGIVPPQLQTRETVRGAMGLPQSGIIFGFVGRLSRQKAPERLLSGFAGLQRKDVRLVILGDGELSEAVRSDISRLGIADRTHVFRDLDGQRAMPAFDFLVTPSRYESAGYVFSEAAAAGVPIISTRVGVAEDIVIDGENGILVDNVDDPEVWSLALERALDPERAPVMLANARSKQRFTGIESMVNETLKIYRESIGGRERFPRGETAADDPQPGL